jgi:carboxymethylenebutenolidase
MTMINIATFDHSGQLDAYVALPAGTPKAAIIVIQEIFGVNPGIRQKCDHWAKLGYLAIAPDLFWRIKPGIQLDPDLDAELQEGFGYFQAYDPNEGVQDIEATIRAIRIEGDRLVAHARLNG